MKKKYKIIIGVVLAFIIANVSWYLLAKNKYGPYVEKVPEVVKLEMNYLRDKDGYNYNVKTPNYLSLTGNLGISTGESEVASEYKACDLLIFPSMLKSGKYRCIATIQVENNAKAIEFNQKFELAKEYDPNVLKEFEGQEDTFEELFNRADKMWAFTTN